MANIILYPPYGTKKEANSLKFEISNVEVDNFNIHIEDTTHSSKVEVKYLNKDEKGIYSGVMNLDIPEHSSHYSISIFTFIDALQEDGSYKTIQILPTIFSVKEESEIKNQDFVLSPSFVGQKELVSVYVKGEPGTKKVFSVNDKRFKIFINEEGRGSFHFKGKDIIGDNELDNINKFPVYIYEEKDNFTNKSFTGSYLNILPTTIVLHAEIDPRCDINDPAYLSPGSWVRDAECDEEPCDPTKEVCCDPRTEDCPCNPDLEDCGGAGVEVCTSSIDIPASCNSGNVNINFTKPCRLHNNSVVMLNNGMALHAYTSVDKTIIDEGDNTFNINKVFLSAQKASSDVQIIANRDVIVESKFIEENFRIHVDPDVVECVSEIGDLESSDVYIVLYNSLIGFVKIKIIGFETDEYTGASILIGDTNSNGIVIDDWIFCVNSVLFHNTTGFQVPGAYIFGTINQYTLPYVRDPYETGSYSQPVNVTIATNKDFVGSDEEIYVYLVVEAVTENNLSQLYFNSLSLGNYSTFPSEELGWIKLTDENQGNNRNPIAKMDSANNLHVIFESDRGDLTQLYYGVVGLNSTAFIASSLSSSIDKYSEFLSKSDQPFDYFTPLLLNETESNEYVNIPEYDTESLIDGGWNIFESDGGNVSEIPSINYLNDITIESNAVYQEAMAVANFPVSLEVDPSVGIPFSQFNYQISFNMEATVSQTSDLPEGSVVNDIEMDNLFSQWKDNYTVSIDDSISNTPIYVDGSGNKFTIGRIDNVYDRIVPLVGSYIYRNPSRGDTKIKILKNDSNLKDFTFGLMFEKTYFKAININTSVYTQETIYTGNVKLVAFIKTEEKKEQRADYIIVREFPEEINISETAKYDIVVNYVRINSDEVENVLNTYNITNENIYGDNKFLGTITLLIEGVPRFSQSFISTFNNEFELNIGFGVPEGGYYVADKIAPSKLGIFDDLSSKINFTDISITSPTYTYNSEVVSMPPKIRDMTKLKGESEGIEVDIPGNALPYNSTFSTNPFVNLNFVEKEEIKYYIEHIETNSNNYSSFVSVSQIEKISIEFITYGRSDRLYVTKKDGAVLYDTGFILSSIDAPFKFDIDVTYINKVYINVELGTTVGNTSYKFTAYFKKVNNDNSFSQVPITFEGINQSADIDIGMCDDVHVAWQSNRDKQWDIYYMNTVDELSPFRYETQITNTESNSLRPSISTSRNNSRMIVWHDNREGDFNVYSARSLEDFGCSQKTCETEMVETFKDEIEECNISLAYIPAESGFYKFVLYFYSDIGLTKLYKAISLEDNEERWFIDGEAVEGSLSYDGDELLGVDLTANDSIVVSYIPDKNDKIFDIIIYVKIVGILSEGEV